MMPGGGRNAAPANYPAVGGGYAMPALSRGGANPVGWVAGAVVFALASAYWYMAVGKARAEAAVIRTWAKSAAVKSAARAAIQTPVAQRKKVVASRKNTLLAAYKAAARQAGAKSLADSPVPFALAELLETKLLKAPAQTVAALNNAAAKGEIAVTFGLLPKLTADQTTYTGVGWGLLSGTAVFAFVGGMAVMPKRRAPLSLSRVADAPPASTPAAAPRITQSVVPAATATNLATPPAAAASTPFPPIPDTIPTINPPMRGSIAAGVAAVASSSSEVTRLVKRLEELESLSERLKGERDETRKELSWTQVALDDFKKRVADATTMAAASAAQSAGASEQRAAQAELRVTEAVEHINEALQRAVETEHGVSRAKEMAQTAEERATHAETRSQEIQFQLSRAMERLADLEQLAASTRFGGIPVAAAPLGNRVPPTTPSPLGNGYRNGHLTSIPSPIDEMLAAAAKPTPASPYYDAATAPPQETTPEEEPLRAESAVVSSMPPRGQRLPPPRLTNTKMSDIEAGLNLARAIRSRTQKAAARATGEE